TSREVQTRILCISDTHSGRPSAFYSKDKGFRKPLPKADLLIHSGDLTMTGKMVEYEDALSMLIDIDAEVKLVIAGNHDLTLDEDYIRKKKRPVERHPMQLDHLYEEGIAQRAMELWTSPRAKEAGIRYLTEGLHEVQLSNGAQFGVYASPWQPEFRNWAFNYPHHEDRWSQIETKQVGKIDIFITHGPPHMHLDLCASGARAGCVHLMDALRRVRPRLHVFGHIHEAWGAERIKWEDNMRSIPQRIGDSEEVKRRHAVFVDMSSDENRLKPREETLLVNACVVDLKYEAENAGWLIDMDL
ncbi:Metallo-dependent phosphatase, partial [Rhizodiscina lignyota]